MPPNKEKPGAGKTPEKPKLSKTERVMESPEYKRSRLRDLTGLEDEQELFEIFYELKQLFLRVGLDNVKYRRNTVDDRQNTETELAIMNLTGEDLEEFEETLRKLRVFGFPETVGGTNYSNLVIDNRRDLEVLRLLSVFRDLDTAHEEKERREQIRRETEVYIEKMRRVEGERIAKMEEHWRAVEERRLKEKLLDAEMEKNKELFLKWNEEKEEFDARRAEEKKKMDEIIDEVLAKIQPQKIDLEFEIESLKDPFEEVTKFHGYQPKLPREMSRLQKTSSQADEISRFEDEVDPLDLDEKMARYQDLWEGGAIADLDHEPIKLPGGHVDLSIFPKKFIWKLDKKTDKKKCFEYDSITKDIGAEVTKEVRDGYIDRLHELRAERFKKEEELFKENGEITHLPKSKEEVETEQKVILTLNNLIVWLINDLTSQMRGNMELRHIKTNDADDLYQNAIIGMFRAIDKLDSDEASVSKPISYILAYMEGYIRGTHSAEHGMVLQKNQVRIPSGVHDARRAIQKTERLLRSQYPAESDHQIMEARLAEALSKPEIGILKEGQGVAELKKLRQQLMMQYEQVGIDELDSEDLAIDTQMSALARSLYSPATQEKGLEAKQLRETMNEVLLTLTPREERVLRARFFPDSAHPPSGVVKNANFQEGQTLEEVAMSFNVSRNRISQIEAKALRKLKHPSRSRKLSSFIENERR